MTLAQATVLVVDDEPELREIFTIWLRRAGATVLGAPNGAEALTILAANKVDVLVSDISMPVMDGVTLVRTLHERGLSLPTIIFVSGFGDVSTRVLYGLGVEATLPKPLGRNQLTETLSQSLLDREELWQTPVDATALAPLKAEFNSLEDAVERREFGVGRGGCCFRTNHTVVDTKVGLEIRFTLDAMLLEGQGIVRWYDPRTQHAGVEFLFLESCSRRWLVDRLRSHPTHSFIPACGLD
jgi:CheY-like chemotaxis protein